MYLLIDSSKKDKISFCFFDNNQVEWKQKQGKSKDFLRILDSFLSEKGLSKYDIQGIAVVTGKGRFTSTRITTVIANIFGYTQDLPLISISKRQAKDPKQLISKLSSQSRGQYISAKYSGKPNIN